MILGAGLTGLAATLHLRDLPVLLVEREQRIGGKARSHRRDGFTFDLTGHWLHLRDPMIQELVRNLFEPGALIEVERRTMVWTHRTMVPYPFQANIHRLPRAVWRQCFAGFIAARFRAWSSNRAQPSNFEEFIVSQFGTGMARHFFVPYYSKFWGFSPDGLAYTQLALPPSSPAEHSASAGRGTGNATGGTRVQRTLPVPGSRRHRQPPGGHTCRMCGPRYALRATLDELRSARPAGLPHQNNHRAGLARLADAYFYHPAARTARSDHNTSAKGTGGSGQSSLYPIPLRYLNIGVRRTPPMREHWVYVPDSQCPFYRMGVFTNAIPAMAPPGCSALWVELADRAGAVKIPDVLSVLVRMGAIW